MKFVTFAAAALCVILPCVLVYRTVVWRDSEERAVAAEKQAAEASRLVKSVSQLRSTLPTTGQSERPDEDVMQIAQRAARDSALTPTVVREVTPLGERASTTDSSLTNQSARLVVEPISLQELGTFLRIWVSSQRVWSVQRLDLSAINTAGSQGRTGDYRAVLSLSAEYSRDQNVKDRSRGQ